MLFFQIILVLGYTYALFGPLHLCLWRAASNVFAVSR